MNNPEENKDHPTMDPPMHSDRWTPPIRDPEPISYLALFLIIVLGVTVANLLSNWITARATQYAMEQMGREAARQMNEQAARTKATMEQLSRDQKIREHQQREETRQQRIASPTGRKLAQQCNDWAAAAQNLKSDAAREEQQRHCAKYQTYLETGQ